MKVILTLTLVLSASKVVPLDFGYHDQTALEDFLTNITSSYPNITHLYSIGKSVRGATLWVIAVGESPKDHVTLRPNVKYVANMHGNEVVGRELVLHLVEHFLTNYGVNDTITNFLKSTTVHLMPTMNPDGFEDAREGNCTNTVGRYNANGFDLNRNFPDQFVELPGNIRQVETQHVMDWIHSRQFVLSANFHGGVEVVNYPWDSYPDANGVAKYAKSPDDDLYIHISKVFSYSHPEMHLGLKCFNDSRETSFTDGITNGALWYPVTGGMQDYNYIHGGCMEVLVEMTCCKYPTKDHLPQMWLDNKDALFNYLMEVHRGVKGLVTDTNNNPVSGVSVSVVGRDEIKSKTTKYGEYWRILLPGQYTLKFTAEGFSDLTKQVTITEGEVTRSDVELTADTSGGASVSMSSMLVCLIIYLVYNQREV